METKIAERSKHREHREAMRSKIAERSKHREAMLPGIEASRSDVIEDRGAIEASRSDAPGASQMMTRRGG